MSSTGEGLSSDSLAAAIARHDRFSRDLAAAISAQAQVLEQLNRTLVAFCAEPVADVADVSAIDEEESTGNSANYHLVARLLGPFELSLGGTPVGRWRSQKAASLLKYILLHNGRPVRREPLVDALWPSSSAKSARNNLNVTIYQLRGMLTAYDPGRHHIVYVDGTYRLDSKLTWWTDVQEHAQAVLLGRRCTENGDGLAAMAAYGRARRLYRGPLLEGDSSGDWFLDDQRRLHEEHCAVLERLGALLFQRGNFTESVAVGEELVAEDPCRESGHQLLMRTYAALEQPQLVVRQYRRCAEVLRRELSLDPGPSTMALYGDLVPIR
jgi:DNA-binding SARP family transcriptional activator